MTRLRTDVYFEVPQLVVKDDLAGQQIELNSGEFRIAIYVPRSTDEFEQALQEQTPNGWGEEHLADGIRMLKMPVFVVRVWGVRNVNAAGFRDQPDAVNIANHFRNETVEAAASVAGRFLDWVRTARRQSWLSLHGERPHLLGAEIFDDETGQKLPFGVIETTSIRHGDSGYALQSVDVVALVAHLESDAEVPVAEALLADAEYFISRPRPDVRRAVLMGAVSCEVRIKETMKALASAEQADLVEALLSNPRDFSLAAASLFDKGIGAVCGKSLRVDDKDLYKRVDTLFQRRNKVAHGGEQPSLDDARDAVGAARQALAWLAALTSA